MSSMLTSAVRNSASTRDGASRQVTSSPRSAEMKAGPRHFWARNQFSDHASRRRAARPYARRTCNYDPLTGFRVVNRSGEDAQGSSKNPQSIGLTTREGSCTDRSRSPPFCESATLSEIIGFRLRRQHLIAPGLASARSELVSFEPRSTCPTAVAGLLVRSRVQQ